MTSVLVVASDHVGSSMAGPGIRYLWFARELARRGHEVTLVVPFDTDLREDSFEVVVDNPWHAGRMTKRAARHQAVVAQRLPVPTMLALAGARTRVIYDLYAPLTIEHAAFLQHNDRPRGESELNQLTLEVALETGDAFVCASERQRDLWLGALVTLGRIEPTLYRLDPSFRSLIDVVPFGIDPQPPESRGRVLKGIVPGIAETDTVALWGGGIWNWFDPLTVIRAIHQLGRPDLKLFILGTRSPNRAVPEMEMQGRAIRLAEQLGLIGTTVFFNPGWVPYEERGAYLLEADVGVSAHFDELETRFAFRTRLLDCVWAGLPIVTTTGDSLAELVGERHLGQVVGYEDVDGYAAALAAVLDRDRSTFAAAFEATRSEFEWSRAVAPLEAMLLDRPPGATRGATHRAARTYRYGVIRTQLALSTRGVGGLAKRIATGVVRRGRGDRAAHPHVD